MTTLLCTLVVAVRCTVSLDMVHGYQDSSSTVNLLGSAYINMTSNQVWSSWVWKLFASVWHGMGTLFSSLMQESYWVPTIFTQGIQICFIARLSKYDFSQMSDWVHERTVFRICFEHITNHTFLKTVILSFAFDWNVMFCEGWCKPVIHITVIQRVYCNLFITEL